MEPTIEAEEPKEPGHSQHASVVPVIPCSGNKASIRISADMDQYMTNIQDQFNKISKADNKKTNDGGVTIVQSSQTPGVSGDQCPVVVTVSGQVTDQETRCPEYSAGKVDITAHL